MINLKGFRDKESISFEWIRSTLKTSIHTIKFCSLVFVQTWFPSYGHAHDEMYTVHYLSRKLKSFAFLPKGVIVNSNLLYLASILFTQEEINLISTYDANQWIQLSEIYFIPNRLIDYAFHSFPLYTCSIL